MKKMCDGKRRGEAPDQICSLAITVLDRAARDVLVRRDYAMLDMLTIWASFMSNPTRSIHRTRRYTRTSKFGQSEAQEDPSDLC